MGRKLFVLIASMAVTLAQTSAPPAAFAASFPEEKPFSKSSFEAAKKAGKPVLVHVTASWCTTCAAQKPILAKLRADSRFKQLTTFNVDFDAQKTVLKALGVQMQSTLIVFKGSKEVGRSSGETSEAEIAALLAKAV